LHQFSKFQTSIITSHHQILTKESRQSKVLINQSFLKSTLADYNQVLFLMSAVI